MSRFFYIWRNSCLGLASTEVFIPLRGSNVLNVVEQHSLLILPLISINVMLATLLKLLLTSGLGNLWPPLLQVNDSVITFDPHQGFILTNLSIMMSGSYDCVIPEKNHTKNIIVRITGNAGSQFVAG